MVSVPSFWEEEPLLWFVQAEAMFHVGRILAQTRMFHMIVARQPLKVLDKVTYIVRDQRKAAYDRLKTYCSCSRKRSWETNGRRRYYDKCKP